MMNIESIPLHRFSKDWMVVNAEYTFACFPDKLKGNFSTGQGPVVQHEKNLGCEP
jgi:hypothetical protein